jgi:hypothetical protein
MIPDQNKPSDNDETSLVDDRRKFLAACGRFAIVTPPALTMLLSTSLNSKAIAQSGGRGDRHNTGGPDGGDLLSWLEQLLGKLF